MTPRDKQEQSNDPLRHYADAACREINVDCSIVGKIGSGNSASVYQVSMPGQHVALKIYDPRFFQESNRDVERRRVLDQMSLKGHGNPNLIDFIEAGPIEDTYYLLMEFLPWKSLDQCLALVDRSEIGASISKIASAAEFLESRNFVHRDIKPANILISEDSKNIKLLDLGVLRPISATHEQGGTDHGYALPFVATAQYSSPAYLFRDSPPTEEMWKALTYYQLGAVLHDLIMIQPIFSHEIRSQNRYRVAAAVLLSEPEVRATDVSPRLITLARNCLLKEDPARLKRVSWASFRDIEESDNDQIRANLGLGHVRAPTRAGLPADRRQSERLRIRLDDIQDKLVDIAQHILTDNGFPQASARKHPGSSASARCVALAFRPSNSVQTGTHLTLVLQMSVVEGSASQCEIALASLLSRGEISTPGFENGIFLWTTTLDDLELEEAQMIAVLSEAFVRQYALADQQLARFEDEACQLTTISLEVA